MCHYWLRKMIRPNNKNTRASRCGHGFTLIEIVTAILVLGFIVSGSLVVINNCLESTADLRMRMSAFSLARENMEKLMGASKVTEAVEYGDSNDIAGLSWETRIEPFYDPHTTRMWIRGVSSASWYNVMGELKTIEFTQWLTDLTFEDVQKILKRQQAQQGALDEQTLAEAQDLLDKVLQARESAGTAGYGNMVELARRLIEEYPNAPAANDARLVLNDLPAPAKQEFNIQPRETTPVSPSVETSSGTSSENQPSSSESGNNSTNTSNEKIFGNYTEAELVKIWNDNPQEFWRIIMESLNAKK
jgi:prepilin-type N-terminal cleavage/methylation domain-containing protein